ncbi:MAG: alpha/beta hydrolase [Burkholderiaceae bacterium]|nr:alpha/beta hydrolase [Burkholderiaceae bacterium]
MSTSYHTAVVDGHKLFYRAAGDVTAPAIVLLHGYPSSSHMYRDLIPLLAKNFRVIAPDYLGFGFSDAPKNTEFNYTFDNLAALTGKLLEQIGVNRYAVYMQDYGGPIGMLLALAHPERITGMVIQNANAYMAGVGEPVKQVFLPLWADRNETTEAPARSFMAAGTTQFQYSHGAMNPAGLNPDSWTHDQALLDRPGTDAYQLDLFVNYQTVVGKYEQFHEYFRTNQPKTLIVWGKHDPFFTEAGAEAYLADLPKAELVWINGGHFVLDEHAAEIAGHITRVFAA